MNIDWSRAPEGATHFDSLDKNWLQQFTGVSLVWDNKFGWSNHHGQYSSNLSEIKCIIAKPMIISNDTKWSGEGLPPVGAVVVIDRMGLSIWPDAEQFIGPNVKVLANYMAGDTPMIVVESPDESANCCFRACMARPVRTPEQIAAEERQREIDSAFSLVNTTTQVPGDFVRQNILRHAIETMIDAGYRKQVTQ